MKYRVGDSVFFLEHDRIHSAKVVECQESRLSYIIRNEAGKNLRYSEKELSATPDQALTVVRDKFYAEHEDVDNQTSPLAQEPLEAAIRRVSDSYKIRDLEIKICMLERTISENRAELEQLYCEINQLKPKITL